MNALELMANLERWAKMHGDIEVVCDKGDMFEPIELVLLAEYEDQTKQIVLCQREFTDAILETDAHRPN